MSKEKNVSKQPAKTELEKRLEAEAAAAGVAEQQALRAAAGEAPAEAAPELAELAAERDELRDQLLRARAEFENARKRMARESERVRKTAAEALIRDLLPVVDHLDLALQHAEDPTGGFAQGVEMVLKQFCEVLARNGVEPIVAEGVAFDPNVHEAMMQRPSSDHAADAVIEEFQKGYKLGDTILRPAKVVVSSGPEASPAGDAEDDGAPAGHEAGDEAQDEPNGNERGPAEDAALVDL